MRSAWNAAVTGIIDAASGYVDCDVFDGAPLTADDLTAAMFVGWQPSNSFDEPAGRLTQTEHDAGLPAARHESGDVKVTILTQTGDLELAPVRSRAFAILTQLQSLLHHIPSAASDGTRPQQAAARLLATWATTTAGQPLRIEVDSVTITQGHSPKGVWTQLDVNVSYDALIS